GLRGEGESAAGGAGMNGQHHRGGRERGALDLVSGDRCERNAGCTGDPGPRQNQKRRAAPRAFTVLACVRHQAASAATRTVIICSGLFGGSPLLILSTFSMPSITLPQTVYCLSRNDASSKQMKNWLFAELGLAERAIEETATTCGSAVDSARN